MTRDEQPEQHPANPCSDDWDRQIAADANNGKLARRRVSTTLRQSVKEFTEYRRLLLVVC